MPISGTRRGLIWASLLAVLARCWPGRATAVRAGENAVDLCRKAIEARPARTEAVAALLDRVQDARLDAATGRLVGEARPALAMLREAASSGRADGGDAWTERFDETFTWMIGARDLGRWASLSARLAFREGRVDDGLDDAFAAMALGRTFGAGRVAVAGLIGLSIEHVAIEVAAIPLPKLDRDRLAAIDVRFGRLRAPLSLVEMVRGEREFSLRGVFPREDDPARSCAWAERLGLLAEAIDDPDPERLARFRAGASPGEFDTIDAFEGALRYIAVKRDLCRSAIAVAADGPDALERHRDPTDGRPFDLRAWAAGFEVGSRFVPAIKDAGPARIIAGTR